MDCDSDERMNGDEICSGIRFGNHHSARWITVISSHPARPGIVNFLNIKNAEDGAKHNYSTAMALNGDVASCK